MQGVRFFEYVSEGVLWASESVSGCCSLHGLQDVHQLSGCRTSISVLSQTPSDQVQQSLVADGLHQLRTTLGGREVAGAHLHQEHTETEDVHLGTLESWVVGLGGSVHWTAGILCLQLTLEVGGAVVGDLGQPASVGRRLEEDVGTAEVPVDDGVGRHVVEVVESAGHVDCDGEEVLQREILSGTSVDQSSETGRHELGQNGHASLQSGSEESQQVGVADSRRHVHFTSEQTSVVVVHQLTVQAFRSDF